MARAAKTKSDDNAGILEYALQHLERERDELQAKIDHVRRQLGRSTKAVSAAVSAPVSAPAAAPAAGSRKKRDLSPEARKRIAMAQKKRWAAHRKAKAAARA